MKNLNNNAINGSGSNMINPINSMLGMAMAMQESFRAVRWNIAMALFKTTILQDVAKVVTTSDNGAAHLGQYNFKK